MALPAQRPRKSGSRNGAQSEWGDGDIVAFRAGRVAGIFQNPRIAFIVSFARDHRLLEAAPTVIDTVITAPGSASVEIFLPPHDGCARSAHCPAQQVLILHTT
ncbi:hypothetical protein [Variovorax rhizosphaerae]|uniref:Uncharacterized protein n=1 Tax=Variovorax rhizosphaerae TaxID=1836200 RepID=A0ABU8WR54_9BURK